MAQIHAWAGLLLMVAASGCSPQGTEAPKERSQRERDSILGASQLPGARGVRGALDAADSAAARNDRIDSMAGGR
jgi:hypothetical protein